MNLENRVVGIDLAKTRLCAWYLVAEHDKEKVNYQTFVEPNKCFVCKGYNDNCDQYIPYGETIE